MQATLVFLLDHLSLVVSASERNKMSAQALATVMGPPLMLHSANVAGQEVDHAQPIAVLKYLLQIWPQPQNSTSGNVISINIETITFTTTVFNNSKNQSKYTHMRFVTLFLSKLFINFSIQFII